MNRKKFTKTALILSVCMLIVWGLLGTGATIAWFADTMPVAKNSFIIGELDLVVSYKNDVVREYTPVDAETSLFNDQALYEPGYTQVVYLKIENQGTVDFDYKLSVDRRSYTDSINVYGSALHLPDYLKFGVIFGADETVLTRDLASARAQMDMNYLSLNTYSQLDMTVPVGGVRYAALVVHMPEEVGNAANYMRGYPVPKVQLGVTVYAQQAGAPF